MSTIPAETIHDTIIKVNDVYHANIVRDSVCVNTYIKGDTVYKDKWHRTIIKDTLRLHDTLYMAKTDTVRIPVPVERKQTWWEKTVTQIKDDIVTLAVVAVIALLLMWYVKRKNN